MLMNFWRESLFILNTIISGDINRAWAHTYTHSRMHQTLVKRKRFPQIEQHLVCYSTMIVRPTPQKFGSRTVLMCGFDRDRKTYSRFFYILAWLVRMNTIPLPPSSLLLLSFVYQPTNECNRHTLPVSTAPSAYVRIGSSRCFSTYMY